MPARRMSTIPADDEHAVCEALVRGADGRSRDALDERIGDAAKNWRVERMAMLDRLVMRLAVQELMAHRESPPRVVISEAIELARAYSGEEAAKFVNGVLDGVYPAAEGRREGRRVAPRVQRGQRTECRVTKKPKSANSGAPTSRPSSPWALPRLPEQVRHHAHGERAGRRRTARRRPRSSRRSRVETITAGRIVSIRSFGKACFLVLSDGRSRIQVYVRQDALSERDMQLSKLLDFGDQIGVAGHLFRTKTNELSIWATSLEFLAKCFLPLPEKWHGLQDVETRYRQRYLDLIVQSRRAPGVRDSQPRPCRRSATS